MSAALARWLYRLAVRLHRRHGWLAAAALYVFLAAASVLTAGLALMAALVVERQVQKRRAAA